MYNVNEAQRTCESFSYQYLARMAVRGLAARPARAPRPSASVTTAHEMKRPACKMKPPRRNDAKGVEVKFKDVDR